MKFIIYSRH